MTQGDVVSALAQVVTLGSLAIQPGAGVEWVIHNIYHEAEVELRIREGATELLFESDTEKGSWSAYFIHLTNTHYLVVKNTNAGSKLISYDGIVSKE